MPRGTGGIRLHRGVGVLGRLHRGVGIRLQLGVGVVGRLQLGAGTGGRLQVGVGRPKLGVGVPGVVKPGGIGASHGVLQVFRGTGAVVVLLLKCVFLGPSGRVTNMTQIM